MNTLSIFNIIYEQCQWNLILPQTEGKNVIFYQQLTEELCFSINTHKINQKRQTWKSHILIKDVLNIKYNTKQKHYKSPTFSMLEMDKHKQHLKPCTHSYFTSTRDERPPSQIPYKFLVNSHCFLVFEFQVCPSSVVTWKQQPD